MEPIIGGKKSCMFVTRNENWSIYSIAFSLLTGYCNEWMIGVWIHCHQLSIVRLKPLFCCFEQSVSEQTVDCRERLAMCVIWSHILTPSGEPVRLQPVSMKPKGVEKRLIRWSGQSNSKKTTTQIHENLSLFGCKKSQLKAIL